MFLPGHDTFTIVAATQGTALLLARHPGLGAFGRVRGFLTTTARRPGRRLRLARGYRALLHDGFGRRDCSERISALALPVSGHFRFSSFSVPSVKATIEFHAVTEAFKCLPC